MKPISVSKKKAPLILGWLTRLLEVALGLKPGGIPEARRQVRMFEAKRAHDREARRRTRELEPAAAGLIERIKADHHEAHGLRPATPAELSGHTELLKMLDTKPTESGEAPLQKDEQRYLDTYVRPRLREMHKGLSEKIEGSPMEDTRDLRRALAVVERALNLTRARPARKSKPSPPSATPTAKVSCPIPEDPTVRSEMSRTLKRRLAERTRKGKVNPKHLPPSPTDPIPELVGWILEFDPTLAMYMAATAVWLEPRAGTPKARRYALAAWANLPLEPPLEYQQFLRELMRWPKIPARQIGKPKGDGATEPPPENITVTTE